jgi:hypothetical protein
MHVYVCIYLKHTSINNAHVHASIDSMIQEHTVHSLSDHIHTTEAK